MSIPELRRNDDNRKATSTQLDEGIGNTFVLLVPDHLKCADYFGARGFSALISKSVRSGKSSLLFMASA